MSPIRNAIYNQVFEQKILDLLDSYEIKKQQEIKDLEGNNNPNQLDFVNYQHNIQVKENEILNLETRKNEEIEISD